MSNKKAQLFDTFSEVLVEIMEGRNQNQSYLAQKTGKDKKQISNYVTGQTTPFNKTQQEIAKSLDVVLEQNEEGKYKLFDPHAMKGPTVEEKIAEYKNRKEKRPPTETERDLLLQFLLDRAESLSEGLRRLIEIEKSGRDDD